MKKNTPSERLINGIIKENPTFVLMLGMCPTLAITTSAINGIGMGLTTTVILAASNLMISLLERGNFIYQESDSGYGTHPFIYRGDRVIRDTVADDNASIRARSVCYSRAFHSADRSKLYRIGTCGSFRSEEQSAGFYV